MEIISKLKNKFLTKEFLKYFLSGITAFLVDLTLLNIFVFLLFKGDDKTILGTLSIAKILSSGIAMGVSFSLNRNWAFLAKNSKLRYQLIKFAAVMLFNYIFAITLYSIFYKLILEIGISKELGVSLSNLLTEGIKMVTTFFFYKYFVFKVK